MPQLYLRTLVLGVLVGCVGCTESKTIITAPSSTTTSTTPPTTPAPGSTQTVTGMWTASVTVQSNTARLNWDLTQNGSAVTGPMMMLLPNGLVLMNGQFSGTLNGSTLSGTINVTPGGIPVYPDCTGQLGANMSVTFGSVSTMSGPLSVLSSTCTVPISSSSITFTR